MSNTKLKNLLDKNELSIHDAKELITAISEKTKYGILSSAGETVKKDLEDAMDSAKTLGARMIAVYERAGEEFESSEPAYSKLYEKTKDEKKKVDTLCKSLKESNDRLRSELGQTGRLVREFNLITENDLDHLVKIANRLKKDSDE